MDSVFLNYARKLIGIDAKFFRYLYSDISWMNKLIGITGPRGTGKSTMVLQHIRLMFPNITKALYIALDDIWFSNNSLFDLATYFVYRGGTHIFIDEVESSPHWIEDIDKIRSVFPELHIVFITAYLDEKQRQSPLLTNAIIYHLNHLSFREFLVWENKVELDILTLENILDNHQTLSSNISSRLKVLPDFKRYLEYGSYMIYKENTRKFPLELITQLNTVLERDLVRISNFEYGTIGKIKKLLMIIASKAPFKPNVADIARQIDATRGATLTFMSYLRKLELINYMYYPGKDEGPMSKPDIMFINNTSLVNLLSAKENMSESTLRETFFINQLSTSHKIELHNRGEFKVDNIYRFELGTAGKDFGQIKKIKNHFLATDDIETGYWNKIPLWLFGFLY